MILPYLVIIMCMTGAIYPSIDMTAGEKERGTMETLLCSPVARTHLVLGKGLVVLTVSLCHRLPLLVCQRAGGGAAEETDGRGGQTQPVAADDEFIFPGGGAGDDAAAGDFLLRRHAGDWIVFPQRQGGQLLSPAPAHFDGHSGGGGGAARH